MRSVKALVWPGCGGCGKAREEAGAWAAEAEAGEAPIGKEHCMVRGLRGGKSPVRKRSGSRGEVVGKGRAGCP